MNRRRNTSIAANPMLIGGVTILVTIVAVFLSYNANNGLPFVPTYDLNAVLPNASGLIKGNEVRQGGDRIGTVAKIRSYTLPDGTAAALVEMHIDKNYGPMPRDTTLAVRPKSPLGLKYVALRRGKSKRTFPSGSTVPMPDGAVRPVEIDDMFAMFDKKTRDASQENLVEYGDAFAGRGADLNEGLKALKPLAEHGEPAARNLADPKTGFDRLFPALGQAAAETAPVAQQNAQLFTGLNQTFTAWSSVSSDLQQAIAEGPEALDVATRELPAQADFTNDSADLFHHFRPAFRELAAASPGLAQAFSDGTPALKRSPQLNGRLVTTLQQLETFAGDTRVIPALDRLTETATLLQPIVSFLTPAQTTCNYFGLFFYNLASALSESDDIGSMLRFSTTVAPQLPRSEAGPAAVPANGPDGPYYGPAAAPQLDANGKPTGADLAKIDDSFLHSNPYPNTAAPGEEHECEAANETYQTQTGHQVIGNQPGNQGVRTEATGDWKPLP